MPTIDMPLEKLHQYQGRNPRPADFDEFWETALAEMRATDPKVELVPVDLPSKIVDFYAQVCRHCIADRQKQRKRLKCQTNSNPKF